MSTTTLQPCTQKHGQTEVIDLSEIDEMAARIGRRPEDLIPLLQAIQKRYNWLPPSTLKHLCEITDITPDAVTGVSTFYSQFRHYPVGRHIIKTCVGTACHVQGASILDESFRTYLEIQNGEHTDAKGDFTVEDVACLGCCMLAPVVQIDDVIYGHVEPWNVPDLIRDFIASERTLKKDDTDEEPAIESAGDVRICLCSSCVAGGAGDLYLELKKLVKDMRLHARVKNVGCTGYAFQTPVVEVALYNQTRHRYGLVKPGEVRSILVRHFKPAGWFRRTSSGMFHLLEDFLTDEAWVPPTRFSKDVRNGGDNQCADSQKRIVTEHAGALNPKSIDDYLKHDGFKAMQACLKEKNPEETIEEIKGSGLRGRGGAGFSTGMKWGFARAAENDTKYIICNGDEGDP